MDEREIKKNISGLNKKIRSMEILRDSQCRDVVINAIKHYYKTKDINDHERFSDDVCFDNIETILNSLIVRKNTE